MSLSEYEQEQLEAAELDSAGRFTIDPQQALQKLIGFSLPDPSWWILKLIQAAVASGASAFHIESVGGTTCCSFEPEPVWKAADVEAALFRHEPERLGALDHLKQAIWSAALNQRLDVDVELRGATGFAFREGKMQRSEGAFGATCFRVKAANPDLPTLLRNLAPACPIPLWVDGAGLGGLLHARHPERQLILRSDTVEGIGVNLCDCTTGARSTLHWVLDGVTIHKQELGWNDCDLLLDLYVPAEGLERTVGGFGLVESQAFQERSREACRTVFPWLQKVTLASDERCLPDDATVGRASWWRRLLQLGRHKPGAPQMMDQAGALLLLRSRWLQLR